MEAEAGWFVMCCVDTTMRPPYFAGGDSAQHRVATGGAAADAAMGNAAATGGAAADAAMGGADADAAMGGADADAASTLASPLIKQAAPVIPAGTVVLVLGHCWSASV